MDQLPVTAGDAVDTAPPEAINQSLEALRHDLERQFATDIESVRVGDWPIQLLRPRNSDDLITEADFVRDERLPYWADLWPSARILAEHLLRDIAPQTIPRPQLVELGCGLGLVTAAALRAGYDVLATDYYADALRFTRVNATGATGREPATRLVDWRDFPADLGLYDRVVAADVLYEHAYAPLISAAIAQMLTADGAAIIADPGRVAAPGFLAGLERYGLSVAETEVRPYEAEPAIRQQITIYTLRRAARPF